MNNKEISLIFLFFSVYYSSIFVCAYSLTYTHNYFVCFFSLVILASHTFFLWLSKNLASLLIEIVEEKKRKIRENKRMIPLPAWRPSRTLDMKPKAARGAYEMRAGPWGHYYLSSVNRGRGRGGGRGWGLVQAESAGHLPPPPCLPALFSLFSPPLSPLPSPLPPASWMRASGLLWNVLLFEGSFVFYFDM